SPFELFRFGTSQAIVVCRNAKQTKRDKQKRKKRRLIMTTLTEPKIVNGLNVDEIDNVIAAVKEDSSKAKTNWAVTTHWRGGTRSDTRVTGFEIAGEHVARDFTIRVDEPTQLLGTNQYANPQEYLLAALNACMIVGYTAACAHSGIELTELRIETE